MLRQFAIAAAFALVSASPALAQGAAKPVRICGGAKGGNYEFSAIQIAQQLRGALPTEVQTTQGSLDNLARLDRNECDVAIVQSDAYFVYMRANTRSALNLELGRVLYPEYVHLICNPASGITRITQLTAKQTVLIGPKGGGSAVTWESFRLADPDRYRPVLTLPIGGRAAVNKVQQGDEAQCMIFVAGLKSQAIMDANTVALQSEGKLALIPADDGDMPGVKDPKGRTLYAKADIPSGTYPGGLQPRSVFGSSVATITVNAVVVANASFAQERGEDYDTVLGAINNAAGAIQKQVTAQ